MNEIVITTKGLPWIKSIHACFYSNKNILVSNKEKKKRKKTLNNKSSSTSISILQMGPNKLLMMTCIIISGIIV